MNLEQLCVETQRTCFLLRRKQSKFKKITGLNYRERIQVFFVKVLGLFKRETLTLFLHVCARNLKNMSKSQGTQRRICVVNNKTCFFSRVKNIQSSKAMGTYVQLSWQKLWRIFIMSEQFCFSKTQRLRQNFA